MTLLLAGCDNGPKPDDNDPWLVVDAYVAALNANDADAVDELVAPDTDTDGAITDRLARLGGRKLDYDTMRFRSIGMAGTTTVDLTLRHWGTDETYRDTFTMTRTDGHWYIDL